MIKSTLFALFQKRVDNKGNSRYNMLVINYRVKKGKLLWERKLVLY